MALDAQPVLKGDFPNPREQAEALLEICQGDIRDAQALAATNVKFAKYQGDRLYWAQVADAISNQEQAEVMERLAKDKLERSTARK